MAQVVIDCPFCHAQNMTMKIFGVALTEPKHNNDLCVATALCTKCDNPVTLRLSFERGSDIRYYHAKLNELLKNLLNSSETADKLGFRYSLIKPPQDNNELSHLPPEIQKTFKQAEQNIKMEGCEEAAVMMYRRALEIAISTQYPQITEKNLKKKIEALETQHIIPAAMKDWAHEIRLIGNDGAHELSGVTRTDARAAQAFTTAFLQYCISLPEEIKQRRAPVNVAAGQAAPSQ